MEFNFDATNTLIDLINKHSRPSPFLQHVQVDKNATIADNAQTLISRMDDIQKLIDDFSKKLSEKLEPTIYEKLIIPDTSFKEKLAIAKKSVSVTISVIASAAGVALVTSIIASCVLKGMVQALGIVKSSALASVVFGVLVLGIDMIASAIIGAIEHSKLEEAINQFEIALETFEPASKEYTKTVTREEIRLEDILAASAGFWTTELYSVAASS